MKRSAWYTTGLDVSEQRRFEDVGFNVQAKGFNLTVHMGPNKLSRYPGFRAGMETAGSMRGSFFLFRVWIRYWTATAGLSWREMVEVKEKRL